MTDIVTHLKLLDEKPLPKLAEDTQELVKPLQPSEILEAWILDKKFEHEGLHHLRTGDCGPAFYVLGMGFEVGAQFQRTISGRKDLRKLIQDLENKGY